MSERDAFSAKKALSVGLPSGMKSRSPTNSIQRSGPFWELARAFDALADLALPTRFGHPHFETHQRLRAP